MKYYKLLFCLILTFVFIGEIKSASAEESIGPIKVKYLTKDGIQDTYTVKNIRSYEDLLDGIFEHSDGSLRSDYEVIFSSSEGPISFETFKKLFREGTASLAVYLVKVKKPS